MWGRPATEPVSSVRGPERGGADGRCEGSRASVELKIRALDLGRHTRSADGSETGSANGWTQRSVRAPGGRRMFDLRRGTEMQHAIFGGPDPSSGRHSRGRARRSTPLDRSVPFASRLRGEATREEAHGFPEPRSKRQDRRARRNILAYGAHRRNPCQENSFGRMELSMAGARAASCPPLGPKALG